MDATIFEEGLESYIGLRHVEIDLKSFWEEGTAQMAIGIGLKKGHEFPH